MARPNKIVVVIAGDPTETVRDAQGDYGCIIAGAIGEHWDGPYLFVDARQEALPELEAADAVVISGSAAHVHRSEPWMNSFAAWLRDAVRDGSPILGLCFGHQLLAQALGGEVASNPRGREIGTVPVERVANDPLFAGIERTFFANACHGDTVLHAPDRAVVLARSSGDEHQCLRFAPRCYGVQFHPEFDGEVMGLFIDTHSDAMCDEGLDPVATRRSAADTPAARRVLANFIHIAARDDA